MIYIIAVIKTIVAEIFKTYLFWLRIYLKIYFIKGFFQFEFVRIAICKYINNRKVRRSIFTIVIYLFKQIKNIHFLNLNFKKFINHLYDYYWFIGFQLKNSTQLIKSYLTVVFVDINLSSAVKTIGFFGNEMFQIIVSQAIIK